MSPRAIVFCTDYGLADAFVGTCHAVIERIAPGTRVIDLSHAVPRQAVVQGAMTISRAVPYVPSDAIVCGVVDPGVGSPRRAIAATTASGLDLVGPDNGLLSLAWAEAGGIDAAVEITSPLVVLEPVSRTFHGRDVFAPAAAWLARGLPLEELGPAVEAGSLVELEVSHAMVTPGAVGARVIDVDGFGNAQLNATRADLEAAGLAGLDRLAVVDRVAPLVGVFADLAEHQLGVLEDSQGMLALVVNRGSAAERLGVKVGDPVVIEAPGATPITPTVTPIA
jgi:S-adenosyl-L-methionine hydrolase (adenosine-forming)